MAGLKNILLVEDDPSIREMYGMSLANAGYAIEVADSAEQMYAKLETFRPDCVFLDVMLPNQSGIEILKELRTNPARNCQDAKIVMLTNVAQQDIADNAIDNGADGFIIKADILPKNLDDVIKSL